MNAMWMTWFETLMLAVRAGRGPALAACLAPVPAVSPPRAVYARRRLITGAVRLRLRGAGGRRPARPGVTGARASGCVLS